MRDLMTTREVAEYLRIKERKVYDLVQSRRIPCTRVTGKWLFPRSLIDLWILRSTEFRAPLPNPAPPVIAGSHDPLLEWAVRESGAELATLFDGSLDGVRRVAERQARACGLHVIDPDSNDYNVHLIDRSLGGHDVVLVEWAWREQGLITAPGNPLALCSIADLLDGRARVIDRQQSAGSHLLLAHLLAGLNASPEALNRVLQPARNESDVALAVADGAADAALGIAAVARQYRLDFVPLHRERYDLLMGRRDYFEPPMQALLEFSRTEGFVQRARHLGGYDINHIGRIVYNAP